MANVDDLMLDQTFPAALVKSDGKYIVRDLKHGVSYSESNAPFTFGSHPDTFTPIYISEIRNLIAAIVVFLY